MVLRAALCSAACTRQASGPSMHLQKFYVSMYLVYLFHRLVLLGKLWLKDTTDAISRQRCTRSLCATCGPRASAVITYAHHVVVVWSLTWRWCVVDCVRCLAEFAGAWLSPGVCLVQAALQCAARTPMWWGRRIAPSQGGVCQVAPSSCRSFEG